VPPRRVWANTVAAAIGILALATSVAVASGSSRLIHAVGAENEYASVIAQIGGKYVSVSAIESNPNADPHAFEASPSVAAEVSSARLVVQNGLGYDSYMNTIENASPSAARKVIDVQKLLGLPDSTANPHLWYRSDTMAAVARAIAADLSAIDPGERGYFAANSQRFAASLQPWYAAIRAFAKDYPHVRVATTEPVGDYLLSALGAVNLTRWPLQADIMNGVDPAPQNVSYENSLFANHRVKVLVYNEQVTDPLTQSFLASAKHARIPVVAVYETMPAPGYDYESWMLAEVAALRAALADRRSTTTLLH
jgi:zinc/manganese transport system substrate-binding protein